MKKIITRIKKNGFFKTLLFLMGSIVFLLIKPVYCFVLQRLRVNNNMILFVSYPDYTDNAKYYYKYLASCVNNKEFIWLVNNSFKTIKKKNTRFIKAVSSFHMGPSLKSLYYASISSEIYYTHGCPLYSLKPKRNQLIINLWHGCGYKKEVKRKKSFIEKNYFDYVLVPGNVFVETKSEFFGCKKSQILPIGYPRYDVLLKEDESTKDFIKKVCGNKKVIIWMPTFRKTENSNYPEERILKQEYDLPLFSCNEDIEKLNEKLIKNNAFLIIKRHPYQVNYQAEKLKLSNILFIDNDKLTKIKIDLYSLLHYCDALITDYSSIAIDYLLIDKPIAFTLGDFEEYSKERGFVFEKPLDYMPGYHIYTKQELLKMIDDISEGVDLYANNRKTIINKVHNKTNNYCKIIDNTIKDIKRSK